MSKDYKIGILGGIGPEASASFVYDLIKKIKASGSIDSNKDFPRILLNSINANEIFGVDDTNIVLYEEGLRELNQYQPNVVCMICNTIHLFYEHLSSALDKSVEFVYLPSIVEEYLTTQTQKICVLGTQNTIINGLYYFDSLENIYLEKDVQNTINMAIFKFNNGEDFSHEKHIIEEAIEDVLIHHSDIKFVMGCTEIRDIIKQEHGGYFIDTMALLLDYIFDRYMSSRVNF